MLIYEQIDKPTFVSKGHHSTLMIQVKWQSLPENVGYFRLKNVQRMTANGMSHFSSFYKEIYLCVL